MDEFCAFSLLSLTFEEADTESTFGSTTRFLLSEVLDGRPIDSSDIRLPLDEALRASMMAAFFNFGDVLAKLKMQFAISSSLIVGNCCFSSWNNCLKRTLDDLRLSGGPNMAGHAGQCSKIKIYITISYKLLHRNLLSNF